MRTSQDLQVTTADAEDVVAAIEAVDLEAPWSEVAPNLRIALPAALSLRDIDLPDA